MSETDETPQSAHAGQPLGGVCRHGRLALRVFVGAQLVYCAFLVVMAMVFSRAADGAYISRGMAEELDLIGLIVSLAYLAVFIWSAVLVLRFTFRAMKNLRLRGEDTDMSPTMAVVWYFIPVAFLYLPFKGMEEIWRTSHARVGLEAGRGLHLGVWWAAWIGSGIVGNLTLFIVGFDGDASAQALALNSGIEASAGLILIVSALFLVRILGEVATVQDQELQ